MSIRTIRRRSGSTVKLTFLAGLARRVTEAIGTTRIPSVTEQLGTLAAQVGMVNSMLSGMEASGRAGRRMVRAEQALQCTRRRSSPRALSALVQSVRDLAGGALIMLPSSAADFGNAELDAIVRKTQRSSDHGAGAEGQGA